MDRAARLLLNVIQKDFPVVSHPYRMLAERIGITEQEAADQIQKLRQEGIIRRIGGVFDSSRLGYSSTLCAGKIPEEKIPLLVEILEENPGVTHNYLRNHAYNVWFTLIASSQAKVEDFLASIRRQCGVREIYSLPAERLFKINVQFDFEHDQTETNEEKIKSRQEEIQPRIRTGNRMDGHEEQNQAAEWQPDLSLEEIQLIRLLQEDLPEGLTPYAELARRLNCPEDEVLERIRTMQDRGMIRRFGAVLRHQKAGFTANVMGVWQVPAGQTEEAGRLMSKFPQISHCYQRPILPDWPYNLFTMIHGQSREECVQTMREVAAVTGVDKYEMLFSIKEFKKVSMKYFME